MSYIRVIPRDLFNEANLLKCLGQLYIKIDYHDQGRFDVDDVSHFDIQQNPDDGSIYVANLPFSVKGKRCHLYRPLNSRQPWPLWLSFPDEPDRDHVAVFDERGELSADFIALSAKGEADA